MQPGTEAEKPRRTAGILSHLKRRWWLWLLIAAGAAAVYVAVGKPDGQNAAGRKGLAEGQRPLPVTAKQARKADMNVNLRALGTVTPVYTVTVKCQVGGQLLRVHYKEGQIVQAGALLAEIDPRPYEVQLMQAEGQLARDESLLKNAEGDLARYKLLLSQDSIADQQVTTQESLVQQYRGAVKTDRGQVANAKLQLTYSRIVSPISGRIGLRLVDPGNMVQANDSTGIAVVTQLQPINVVFSVPQDNLPAIMKRVRAGDAVHVSAWSQDGKTQIAEGTLLAVDNQIDTTTGTIKMKARFENKKNELFANQFVNIVMKIDTLKDATIMPAAAIQRGSIGTFVYIVKEDKSIAVRQVTLGPVEGENVAVTAGLAPGEWVVVVGGDKLREGTKVETVTGDGTAGAPAQGGKRPREGAGARKEKR